jgi:uncharacterized protein (DUF2252 family)
VTTTNEGRRDLGRALRAVVPRSTHGEWSADERTRDPIEVLEQQAQTRVADLVPVRYERMAESPFAFYRGAAAVMAADLATTPVTGLTVQACGDAHVANFGTFATPERAVVFDINDFDETDPGPWEWDVKRLAASLHVVALQHGFATRDRDRVVTTAVRVYREYLDEAAEMVDDYHSSLTDDRRFLLDRFRLVDVARRVVGVGSVGARCWVCLFEATSAGPGGDRIVLQVKEAQPSVLAPYVDRRRWATRVGASSPANGSPRPPATSSSGGPKGPAADVSTPCGNSGT